MFGLFKKDQNTGDNKHLRRIWTATKFASNIAAADDKANSFDALFNKYGIDFSDQNFDPTKIDPLLRSAVKFDDEHPVNGGVLVGMQVILEIGIRGMAFSEDKKMEVQKHLQSLAKDMANR